MECLRLVDTHSQLGLRVWPNPAVREPRNALREKKDEETTKRCKHSAEHDTIYTRTPA